MQRHPITSHHHGTQGAGTALSLGTHFCPCPTSSCTHSAPGWCPCRWHSSLAHPTASNSSSFLVCQKKYRRYPLSGALVLK